MLVQYILFIVLGVILWFFLGALAFRLTLVLDKLEGLESSRDDKIYRALVVLGLVGFIVALVFFFSLLVKYIFKLFSKILRKIAGV